MADLFEFECSADLKELEESVRTNLNRGLPEPRWGSACGIVSICANGPSLKTIFPTEEPIVALNGAWRVLVENGVMPTYIVAYDPSPENVAWFKDAPKEPVYLLGSRLYREAFDLLEDYKVRIWHLLDDLESGLGAKNMVYGGPTVGLHAMNLMAALGYSHMNLYGYDSCYQNGQHHATPQQWNLTPPMVYSVGEEVFIAEKWMAGQCQEFFKIVEANRFDYTVDVKSPGMLQALVRMAWGRTHNRSALEAVYDLNQAPGSFDFIWSLMNIENYRKGKGYSRTRVHFKAGSDKGFRPNEIIDLSHEHKSGMMNYVVRPLLKMFGCEETDNLTEDTYLTCTYSPVASMEAWKQTGHLPSFQASQYAMDWAMINYKGVITITLREAHYWPQRNSNVPEWIKFANYIRSIGERVVVVRDTYKATERFGDHELCVSAAVDLDRRLALYRAARMNFFIVNGPAGLAWATNDIPYVTMWTQAPGYPCYQDEWLRSYQGFPWGGQYPWRDPKIQAIVWKDDTFDNILEAYCSMVGHRYLGAA